MGIFKVFIKPLFLFSFGIFFGCKPQPKEKVVTLLKVSQDKDTLPTHLNYLTKNHVLGKFDYTKDSSFIQVSREYSNKEIYVRKEVLFAFLEMQKAAKKDSISFSIISGTRNFEHQKRIWNYKWKTKYKSLPEIKRIYKILEYSSMPSTSRHHWGTDIDLNSLNNSYFSFGKGKKTYNWLVKNASKFGFYQVYTSKENGRTGYKEEKWHWSYAPLSSKFLRFYNEKIKLQDIVDFKGSTYTKEIGVIKKYVNGINPTLLDYK